MRSRRRARNRWLLSTFSCAGYGSRLSGGRGKSKGDENRENERCRESFAKRREEEIESVHERKREGDIKGGSRWSEVGEEHVGWCVGSRGRSQGWKENKIKRKEKETGWALD